MFTRNLRLILRLLIVLAAIQTECAFAEPECYVEPYGSYGRGALFARVRMRDSETHQQLTDGNYHGQCRALVDALKFREDNGRCAVDWHEAWKAASAIYETKQWYTHILTDTRECKTYFEDAKPGSTKGPLPKPLSGEKLDRTVEAYLLLKSQGKLGGASK